MNALGWLLGLDNLIITPHVAAASPRILAAHSLQRRAAGEGVGGLAQGDGGLGNRAARDTIPPDSPLHRH